MSTQYSKSALVIESPFITPVNQYLNPEVQIHHYLWERSKRMSDFWVGRYVKENRTQYIDRQYIVYGTQVGRYLQKSQKNRTSFMNVPKEASTQFYKATVYKTGVTTSFQLQLKGMIQPFKITQQTHFKNQHLTSEKK